MTKFGEVFTVAGLLVLQACSSSPAGEELSINRAAVTTPTATATITFNNGGIYCAMVTVPNNLSQSTNLWKVVFDIESTTIYSSAGANLSATTGLIVATPNSSTLIGLRLYGQWFSTVEQCGFAGCNLIAVVTSDAAVMVIG